MVLAARLPRALSGGFAPGGRTAVFHPAPDNDLSAVPDPQVISPLATVHARWPQARLCPDGRYDSAIVIMPRSKREAHALIAQAMQVTDGMVLIDGQKTDGIDGILRRMRARVPIDALVSKAHGKTFWLPTTDAFADWTGQTSTTPEGFCTEPGVFSQDKVDPGSAHLAQVFPGAAGAKVADLGAGWGYLSAQILNRADVESCHIVEVHAGALACARQNIRDPRACFYWADARTWDAPALMDTIIMNPPFHSARAADVGLGRAFVAAAARLMHARAQLWMVANRHLPYEDALRTAFREVDEIGGDARFKLFRAARPSGKTR